MAQYTPYIILGLSIISLWFSKKRKSLPITLAVVAISTALILDKINLLALAGIVATALLFRILNNKKYHPLLIGLAGISFLAISYLLFYHQFPGLNNFKVLDHYLFSTESAPFTLYSSTGLNFK